MIRHSNEISVEFKALPVRGKEIDRKAREILAEVCGIHKLDTFETYNTNYFKYKTKIDEIRENIDNFGEEYLNEWEINKRNYVFDTTHESSIRKMYDLWLSSIKEAPLDGEVPWYVGLCGRLQMNQSSRFSNIYNEISTGFPTLMMTEPPKFLETSHMKQSNKLNEQFRDTVTRFMKECGDQTHHSIAVSNKIFGAVVGNPNDIYNHDMPKFSIDDCVFDFDYENLYPKVFFSIEKTYDRRPKRRGRMKLQFYKARDAAMWDLEFYHELLINLESDIITARYKHRKRVWNRMNLSYKQYMSGKRKLKLPRRMKKK